MDPALVRKRQSIEYAQATLRSLLEELLGPDLPGVSAFGARLDHATHQMALDVMVDNQFTAERAAALPKTIQGLPVKISRSGPALFE